MDAREFFHYYQNLGMNEKEFRRRTGTYDAKGVVIVGRIPKGKEEIIIHEGFHGLDMDYSAPSFGEAIEMVKKACGMEECLAFNYANELLTDMRTVAYLREDFKIDTIYLSRDKHREAINLLSGRGNLLRENRKVLESLLEEFNQNQNLKEL